MAGRWGTLSSRTRKMIIAAAVAEGCLKTAALVDMKRRPASQVRGSKLLWIAAVLVNSAGLGSLAYFFFGRRRDAS